MKKNGYRVEYVTEYAKDLVYSKDFYKIKDQLMILAKQHHPWFKLEDQVDFTINDGPFLLGCIYLQDNQHLPKKEFEELLIKIWNSYNHINIFLERNLDSDQYQQFGRNQTLEESKIIDNQIISLLEENKQKFHKVKIGKDVVENVLKIIEKEIKK